MITLDELIRKQKEFDEKHHSSFDWDEKISEKNIELLSYLLLATVGELGETTNILKKVLRGDKTFAQMKKEMSEEIIDILIYVVKIIYQLDIDVDKVYSEKMEKNELRFKQYKQE